MTMLNPNIIKEEECCSGENSQLALDFGLTATSSGANSQNGAATNGKDGLSAYQIALAGGFQGNYIQWLASLVGPPGLSAYQVAVQQGGYVGDLASWLLSLVGKDGLSAYQLAVEHGFEGTEVEWLSYLANSYNLPLA